MSNGTHNSLSDGLGAAGWQRPLYETIASEGSPGFIVGRESVTRDRPLLGSISFRRAIAKGLFMGVRGALNGGRLERTDGLQRGRAELDYRMLTASLQGGITLGWIHAAAGPAYTRASGTWRAASMFNDESPPEDGEWSEGVFGVRGEVTVLVPITARLGLVLNGHYTNLPDAEVPGYLNMPATSISLSDGGVSSGVALKF
jgi:hypothetical protein